MNGVMDVWQRRKTLIVVLAALACVVLTLWLVYINRSWTYDEVERAKVVVEQRECYAVVAGGREVAYFSRFSVEDSTMVGLTFDRDAAMVKSQGTGVWVNSSSMFPSAFGRILAVDAHASMETHAQYINRSIREMLRRNHAHLLAEQERVAGVADEVDYYLLRHSIADYEYIKVADYSYAQVGERKQLDKMLALFDSLEKAKSGVEVLVLREYQMGRVKLHLADGVWESPVLWHMRSNYEDVRFVVLGSDSIEGMPDSCFAFSTPLFVDTDFSDRVEEWHQKFQRGDRNVPLYDGTALTALTLEPMHEGDTLCVGETTDTAYNHYKGQMTDRGVPRGYGVMRYGNGDYYEGEWLDGARHGHGFLVSHTHIVKAGEWTENKYVGEKMTYTDGRVYGIDISRYQHEIHGQVFGINWNAMRITSLGKRNSPQVEGDINFPVSFVYIKSTQGVTIKSAYYQQDSEAARAHGILCGAYHFFSFKATGKEQAKYFLENTRILSGDMPPVLDVEPSDEQIEQAGGEERLFADMRSWLQTVERAVGKRPILYVSQNFIKYHLVHAPDLCHDYQVWIARYNVYRPDVRLLFWQLCYDGRVAGIHGGVDINIFNGYREQYEEFAAQQ